MSNMYQRHLQCSLYINPLYATFQVFLSGSSLLILLWLPFSSQVIFILFAFSDFGSHCTIQGYAYILTHPGIPLVFYDHFFDRGDSTHNEIVMLVCYFKFKSAEISFSDHSKIFKMMQMDIRRRQAIHSRSSIRILEAQPNVYAAVIDEKVSIKIGDGSWCPAGSEWTLATSGQRYAVWEKQPMTGRGFLVCVVPKLQAYLCWHFLDFQ